jgi:hypothetical protein
MMPTISPDSPRPERSKTVEKPGVGTGQTHQQFISRKASGNTVLSSPLLFN